MPVRNRIKAHRRVRADELVAPDVGEPKIGNMGGGSWKTRGIRSTSSRGLGGYWMAIQLTLPVLLAVLA